jgi:hypothetical protein
MTGRLGFLWLFILIPFPASAQLKHGTVVVFFVSRDKIVVAADSRGLIEHEGPNDHMCKITGLGTRLLFAQAGLAGISHAKDPSNNWSGSIEAVRSFSNFQKSKSRADVLDQVSGDWAESMKKMLSRMLEFDRQLGVHHYEEEDVLTRAVFVGLDQKEQIKVREIAISFDRGVFEKSGVLKIWASNELWNITDQTQYKAMGHIKIANEFAHASSTRGLLDAEYWKSEMSKPGDEELYAAHLVEVTEAYAPEELGVGGPVDVVDMFPGEGLHWVRRKPECPKDGVGVP